MPIYKNNEIKIELGDFELVPQSAVDREPTYLESYSEHIRFCRQPSLPPYMQQVSSSDGWLCDMYVLDALGLERIKADIPFFYAHLANTSVTELQELEIANFCVLHWRLQQGKTRRDHFLVLLRQHNYLLVSSPYGDGNRIRQVIAGMECI